MKSLAITNKGFEDITSLEIKELINAPTEIRESCIVFDFNKYEDLFLLSYKAQSINRLIYLLREFKIRDISDFKKEIKKIKFSEFIRKNTKFAARCFSLNENFHSQEIESETGDVIDAKVDLDNPEITAFIFIAGNNCYVGIDFSGDISKREYKIYTQQNDLKGTIAYALARLAGYEPKKTMLDTFCGTGAICIESALFASDFPVNFFNKNKFPFLKFKIFSKFNFDKFFENIDNKINKKIKLKINCFDTQQRFVANAEKNAKIAGIKNYINFSRVDTEYLELKFEKEIDIIVTNPPRISKNINPKDTEKIYNEFFYQADYMMKKKARIVIISNRTEELKNSAEKNNFKAVEERNVWQGKEQLKVAVFEKK